MTKQIFLNLAAIGCIGIAVFGFIVFIVSGMWISLIPSVGMLWMAVIVHDYNKIIKRFFS